MTVTMQIATDELRSYKKKVKNVSCINKISKKYFNAIKFRDVCVVKLELDKGSIIRYNNVLTLRMELEEPCGK